MVLPEIRKTLNRVPALINKTFPIPERFRRELPSDIAELSRLLTNKRGERSLSYLGRPNYLSAYLHYFLPWNLYRLCFLLPNLKIELPQNGTITDLGCGPLTFTAALWISRPDLRSIPLEFNCIDRVSPIMEAGKLFFNALVENRDNENAPHDRTSWKINLIKKDINVFRNEVNKDKRLNNADFLCAVNLFNEIYEKIPHTNTEKLRQTAKKAAFFMHSNCAPNASILTVEPGVPQSGRFISFLRDALMELGQLPASPCTHAEECPLGIRPDKKWCHFAFNAGETPKELQRLSAAAKLPKDRLALSFLQTNTDTTNQHNQNFQVRIISDAFPLKLALKPANYEHSPQFGRYGCSSCGLVLVSGEKNRIEKLNSLSVISDNSLAAEAAARDKKSGALILELV